MYYNFDVDEAVKYGLEESIIIYNLKFWIIKNKSNQKNMYDNRTWTYNSIDAFTKQFPFWSRRQIDRILKSLIEQEVIITANYNKVAYDRTLWYAFKDESFFLNGAFDFTERGKGSDQTGKPIPDIIPDIKKDIIPDVDNTLINVKEKTLVKREDLFNLFWSKYGKQVGKQNTIKQWNKLTEQDRINLLDSINNYTDGGKKEIKFRKDPERYISSGIYKDYLNTRPSTNAFKELPVAK